IPGRDWREHRPWTVRRSGSPRPEGAAAGLLSSAWRPAALAGFLRLNDPGAQLDRWRTDLDGPALRALMAVALRPGGLLAAFLRRGSPRVIPARFDTVLRQRFAACVARYPNAGNPWLWGLLLGTEPAVAPRPAVEHRVRWERADVAAHLEAVPEGWDDAGTLSHVLRGPPAPDPHRGHPVAVGAAARSGPRRRAPARRRASGAVGARRRRRTPRGGTRGLVRRRHAVQRARRPTGAVRATAVPGAAPRGTPGWRRRPAQSHRPCTPVRVPGHRPLPAVGRGRRVEDRSLTMWDRLRRHPLAMRTRFGHSLVLTYAFAPEVLAPLLPPGLALDTYTAPDGTAYGFVAVGIVSALRLRPAFLPAACGLDYVLTGYRVFARFPTPGGRVMRGLKILRRDTDRRLMVLGGNLLTRYHYRLGSIDLRVRGSRLLATVHSRDGHADLAVAADLAEAPAGVPARSPLPPPHAPPPSPGP